MIQVKRHHGALPANDPRGKDMDRRIGAWLSHVYSDKPVKRDAVKSLQGGLNKLEKWRQVEKNRGLTPSSPPLKEDGALGPKTITALKRTLATDGAAQADNAQALGGFHNDVEAGRKGGFKDLAKTVDKSFGALFRDPAKPMAAKAARYESRALQDTVNHFGEKHFGRDQWTPLKDDGWIGPKTTNAFAKVAKAVNPERLTRRFGRYLGFI